MIIRIETENANHASFLRSLSPRIKSNEDTFILNLNLKFQKKDKWCWASIAEAIGNFYGTGHWEQYQIVKQVFDVPDSENLDDPSDKYNCDTTLDKALSHVNCFSHWSLGKPSFERIVFEISMGKPVSVRVEWLKGGAHYVLIKGFKVPTRELYLDDSLFGPSVAKYDYFPAKYQKSGGVWTDTFWTINNK